MLYCQIIYNLYLILNIFNHQKNATYIRYSMLTSIALIIVLWFGNFVSHPELFQNDQTFLKGNVDDCL